MSRKTLMKSLSALMDIALLLITQMPKGLSIAESFLLQKLSRLAQKFALLIRKLSVILTQLLPVYLLLTVAQVLPQQRQVIM